MQHSSRGHNTPPTTSQQQNMSLLQCLRALNPPEFKCPMTAHTSSFGILQCISAPNPTHNLQTDHKETLWHLYTDVRACRQPLPAQK